MEHVKGTVFGLEIRVRVMGECISSGWQKEGAKGDLYKDLYGV